MRTSMRDRPLRRDGLVRRTRPFLLTFAVAMVVALYPYRIDDGFVNPRGAETLRSLRITNGVAIGIRVEGFEGVLAITSHDRRPFTTAQAEQLSSFATILNIALSRALQHAVEATTDVLTGLANRREFSNRLATIPRGDEFAVLSMDVDGLKRVIDTAGHAAGDALLRGVADALRRSVRGSDIVARMGGDEFCALLHRASAVDARAVAERIVAQVHAVRVKDEPGRISVGCALVTPGQDPAARLAAADAAMYQAKAAGGSRVAMDLTGREAPEVMAPPATIAS
jgi:diguanylate cyclase (GGDEF)-like protein